MHRTDRLLGILLYLQARGRASGAELASHFEVSRRTILRDMESLSAQGVPLEAESGPGGGFRLMRGYFLPPLVFQPDEAWALFAGLRILMAHGAVPQKAALTRVADKVAAVLDPRTRTTAERMARRVGVHIWEVDPGPWLDLVAQAVLEGTGLQIVYEGPDGATEREIDPYLLYSQGGIWLLQAYCHLRSAIRIFRVDRIQAAARSGRGFVPPADLDVAQPYAYRRPPGPPNVRLRCTPEAARRLADHPEWRGALQPDGTAALWVPPDQLPYIARLLLGLSPGITVLEPPALRALLVGLAERVADANR